MNDPMKAVTILQACALVGVCRRTIYHWLKAGKIEYIRTAGGQVRIFEDSLWKAGAMTKLAGPEPNSPSKRRSKPEISAESAPIASGNDFRKERSIA